MSQEVISITEATGVERALAAGTPIVAASDIPEDGPWNAMLTVVWYDIADPGQQFGGTGVEIAGETKSAATYRITVTPAQLPFAGKLRIGS
jgi:hypothetical protein